MKTEEKSTNNERQALIIRKYQQYLKLEKALSANTLDAYLTDLNKLLCFLKTENIDMLAVTLDDLQRFAAGLHDIGIHPRSQARILSGIKSFFHFLVIADYQEADPSELLEGPKIGFRLPEVLTVEEIDRIISTVDMEKKEGQRNRAILETLYSCGLRVSELCNLKISDLYFEEGFIKVEGKGSKQRLVPISPRAIKEIKYWFADRNLGKIKKGYEDYVFLARWGNNISRIMSVCIIDLLEMVNITHNYVYRLTVIKVSAHGIGKILVKALSVFKVSKLIGYSSLVLEFLFHGKFNSIYDLTALLEIAVIIGSKSFRLFRNDNTHGFSA